MKTIAGYWMNRLFVIGLILISFSCNPQREKDSDEIVLSEMVIEKNGIYYEGDCEIHAKERFSGACKFYHSNGKQKGVVHIENGLPTGHWKYWDASGVRILDMYFEQGVLIKKKKNRCKNK